MGKYLKKFNTHAQYAAYISGQDAILPNVSYCVDNNDVHYNPLILLIVKYTVTDVTNPTQLYFYFAVEGAEQWWINGALMFDKVEIDGEEVSISDLDTSEGMYQLSVGEHTVKYTLKNPTVLGVVYNEQTGAIEQVGGMFERCVNITSVNIPNTVTSINRDAFYDCDSITSIGVTGSGASIEIPNSVTTIGIGAFNSCTGLTSVTIPNSVTSIGDDAFYWCRNLTSIKVNSGNTVYDSRNNCNAIIETATNTLIQGCQNTIIPNTVVSIGKGAFSSCTGLTSVTIPNSVTSIGDDVFLGCTGLTSVTIPNSVTSIGDSAFKNSGITSLDIPNSITSISDFCFSNCTGLTNVILPETTTYIGIQSFLGCTSLISFTVKATTPPTLKGSAFYNINPNIYVPAESVAAYKAASGWSDYASRIQAIPTT